MKKRSLKLTALGFVAAIATLTIFTTHTKDANHDLIMRNLEALTDNEIVKIPCSKADNNCVFNAINAEGQYGKMTVSNHKNAN